MELIGVYPTGKKGGTIFATAHFFDEDGAIDLRMVRVKWTGAKVYVELPFSPVKDPEDGLIYRVPYYIWPNAEKKRQKVNEMRRLLKEYFQNNTLDLKSLHLHPKARSSS